MKKIGLKIAALLLVVLLLTGCGQKESPADILASMQAALEATPCTGMRVTMDLGMTLDGIQTNTLTEMDIEMGAEANTGVVKTSVVVTGDGVNEQIVTDVYLVKEADKLVAYTNANGMWSRVEGGMDVLTETGLLSQPDSETTVLDEEITDWQGKPAICLHTTLSGIEIQQLTASLLSGMDSLMAEGQTRDFSQLTGAGTLYLDPETRLPMAQQVTVSGLGDMLAPLYAGAGISVQVDDYTVTAEDYSYRPAEAVQVPAEALESVAVRERLAAGEPDNGDGTFTFYGGEEFPDILVDVTLPEGFEVEKKAYDGVILRREDHREVSYILYHLTEDDGTGAVFSNLVGSNANRWQQNGGSVEREQGVLETAAFDFTCDLLATQWSSLQEANFYAWTLLDSDPAAGTACYLYVEVSDGINDGMGFVKNADITGDEFLAYWRLHSGAGCWRKPAAAERQWTGAVKGVLTGIEQEIPDKIVYIADYEGRSVNSHVPVLIRESIRKYEAERGPIEGDIRPDVNVKPARK